ncbi:leucyl aminopeptidase [Candidatus Woesearchaeota archaeon]|nr:leucyl aminopeptidase [Candidatus Woesearchaeota archaeon]
MKISVKESIVKNLNEDVLIIPVFKDTHNTETLFLELDNILNKLLTQTIYENKDICEEYKLNLFYTPARIKLRRILLAGVGKIEEMDQEKIRLLGGKLAGFCTSNSMSNVAFLNFGYSLKNIAIDDATKAFVEGFLLGAYSYDELKTKKKDDEKKNKKIESLLIIPQVSSDINLIENVIKEAEIICRNVNLVRDLVNKPSNILTPEIYAKVIKETFRKTKVKVKVMEFDQIKKEKMGCIIGVGKGSEEKPKLVLLAYTPQKSKKTIALVGKGVTFDSGGINLKPSNYLTNMKDDMAGSATVAGVIKIAAELKLPVKLIGIMPLVENMPSGSALKTGDVISAANGKTIEVENTDAEGRLILADALHYASTSKPDYIIDIATLTGAALVALGSKCTSVMGNDQDLVNNLIKSGEETHELAWQLPLIKEYEDDIKSDIADLKNLGAANGEAGTIIGGIFLKNFVGENKWAHLDIGATVWASKGNSYNPKGATGVPVRMLMRWLKSL